VDAQVSSSLPLSATPFPLLGVGRRGFLLGDHRPLPGQIGIQLLVLFLARGDFILGEDGLDRTLGLAQRAVDALVRIE
jgi:hypothetical protein